MFFVEGQEIFHYDSEINEIVSGKITKIEKCIETDFGYEFGGYGDLSMLNFIYHNLEEAIDDAITYNRMWIIHFTGIMNSDDKFVRGHAERKIRKHEDQILELQSIDPR